MTTPPRLTLSKCGERFMADVHTSLAAKHPHAALLQDIALPDIYAAFPSKQYMAWLCETCFDTEPFRSRILAEADRPVCEFKQACDALAKHTDHSTLASAIADFVARCVAIVPTTGIAYLHSLACAFADHARNTTHDGLLQNTTDEQWWAHLLQTHAYPATRYWKRDLQEMVDSFSAAMPVSILSECYCVLNNNSTEALAEFRRLHAPAILHRMAVRAVDIERGALLLCGVDTVPFADAVLWPARCALNPLLSDAGMASLIRYAGADSKAAGQVALLLHRWQIRIQPLADPLSETKPSLSDAPSPVHAHSHAFDAKSRAQGKTSPANSPDNKDHAQENTGESSSDDSDGETASAPQTRNKSAHGNKSAQDLSHIRPTETRPETKELVRYSVDAERERAAVHAIAALIESVVTRILPRGKLVRAMSKTTESLLQIVQQRQTIAATIRERYLARMREQVVFGMKRKADVDAADQNEPKRSRRDVPDREADVFLGHLQRLYRCGLLSRQEAAAVSLYLSAWKKEQDAAAHRTPDSLPKKKTTGRDRKPA
jgi:hypothetical protein